MAPPVTWVTAELVPASKMNLEIRDKLNSIAIAKALVIGLGDFNGPPLATGLKAYVDMPFGMRVTGWTLYSDVPGSIQLDIWRSTFAAFAPPTHPAVGDSITGSEKPLLSAVQKGQDLTLSTWITDLLLGDVLAINVDSTGGVIKQATLTLRGVLLDLV